MADRLCFSRLNVFYLKTLRAKSMILSVKGRLLVGVGVFLGMIFIFYFFVYLPQINYKNSLNRKISQQTLRLVKLEKKFQELEEAKRENQRIQQNLSFLEEKLRETQASFLYELGVRGKVYGIEYVNIVPLPIIEEEDYFRTPLNIHLYGKYHNLGMLLSDMARRGGLGSFTVDNVLLKVSNKKGYTIEANLALSLYKYKGISTPTGAGGTSSARVATSKKAERRKR